MAQYTELPKPRNFNLNKLITHIIFNNSVRSSQETHHVSSRETNRLILYTEIMCVYSKNHKKHLNLLIGQNSVFPLRLECGRYTYHYHLKG
jgi:hypothetical protein